MAKVRLDGYFGFIDAKGKMVISNEFDMAERFVNGIAIVYKKEKQFTINTKGEIVKENITTQQKKPSQIHTRFYLDEYGDLKEKYESKFETIGYNHIQEFGDYLVYSEENQYGIANLKKGFVTDTWFDGINIETLTDDLIQLENNKKICYINQQGESINIHTQPLEIKRFLVSGKNSTDEIIQPFNISYKREANYEVGSVGNMPILRSSGGWLPSKNVFKKITSIYNFKPNSLDIVVDNERSEVFEEVYEGYKFYISNNTKDSIFFEAYNSNIDIVVQAQNIDGKWKDIEYQFKNMETDIEKGRLYLMDKHAFHQLYLTPKTYWELYIPKYYGIFKTKLRLKLTYKTQRNTKEKVLYSNEFDGSVNPAQFWYLQKYEEKMQPWED